MEILLVHLGESLLQCESRAPNIGTGAAISSSRQLFNGCTQAAVERKAANKPTTNFNAKH